MEYAAPSTALPPLLLGASVALVGLGATLAVLALLPGEVRAEALRGFRETKRQAALQSSALLRSLWPLAQLMTWYARLLPGRGWRARLQQRLIEAGEPLGMTPDDFVGLNLAVVLLALGVALFVDRANHIGPVIYLVALVFGVAGPRMRLTDMITQRFKAINRGLPPVLDLVVMAMVAGSDFMNALGQVVARWTRRKDPLYEELTRFLGDLTLGVTRREALESFAARAPTEMVKSFAGSVVEAEQRGTPLVEILGIQAEVARTKRFQTAEKVAARAGVLVKLPLLIILVACLLIMFGGFAIKVSRGQML